jgi:hypothetical protein
MLAKAQSLITHELKIFQHVSSSSYMSTIPGSHMGTQNITAVLSYAYYKLLQIKQKKKKAKKKRKQNQFELVFIFILLILFQLLMPNIFLLKLTSTSSH